MFSINDNYNSEEFKKAGIKVPTYDSKIIKKNTIENPKWIHFGAGNLFRCFHAKIAQGLIEKGLSDTGIIAVNVPSKQAIEEIYRPHKNRVISVVLEKSGKFNVELIASITESLALTAGHYTDIERAVEIFTKKSLQLVTFTITEKGYKLFDIVGNYQENIRKDIENGPVAEQLTAMGMLTYLLFKRFKDGEYPITLLSTDNFSHNGDVLKKSVTTVANEWFERGGVTNKFLEYIDYKVGFPYSVIDRITPGPSPEISDFLKDKGLKEYGIWGENNNFSVFVNTEKPKYLVIEENFSMPPLDKIGGVFVADKNTTDNFEKMKVCTCLNPLHTALAIFGCLLGYKKISDEMNDKDLVNFISNLAHNESMKVVVDPKIIKPQDFLNECLNERFPNPYLPDTPQRIAMDTSQKLSIRFGETIKEYIRRGLDITKLKYIPAVYAGWMRYLKSTDDNGNVFELSSDPLLDDVKKIVENNYLEKLLSNTDIFGVDLVKIGLSNKVIEYYNKLQNKGDIRKFLHTI